MLFGTDAVQYLSKLGLVCYAGVRKQEDFDKWKNTPNVVPVLLDVADPLSIQTAVETVRKDLKERSLDLIGIVNNAGISRHTTSALQM
jgi:NAD(P)-dependent dehydrogenase (short-subunit alcohol dehydrogenase family)